MVHVQAILFASLALSLLAAFLAMLGKQWLNRYESTDMGGSAVERCQNRQRKLDGIVAWYFDHVLEALPLMLQGGLLLLGCALSRYLWDVSVAVASVVIGVTSLGVVSYIFIIVAGAVSVSCPYQTPGSRILRHLGPRVWRTILPVPSAIGSVLGNAFQQSKVVKNVVSSAKVHDPWWSSGEIIPFLMGLILKIPLGFAVDVYRLGLAGILALSAVLVEVYHFVRNLGVRLHGWRTTPSDFRCISWTLQTSLDKSIHLTASEHLASMAEFTGLDPTLIADCFNVFVGCVSFSKRKLVVIQGLEQLATVSAGCLFRTFRHIWVTDPTSSVLADLRRRYDRVFPPETNFKGLPFYHTITMIHALVHNRWNLRNLRWDDYKPSVREHIPFARHMVEVAQVEYRRMQRRKVPRWILRFALHSLSLNPPSPESVVADCLTIVAIDLGCDVSDIATSDERCV